MSALAGRTAAGRADLVRALAALPCAQHALAAATLGFVAPKKPEPEPEIEIGFAYIDDIQLPPDSEDQGLSPEPVPADGPGAQATFLRLDRMEFTDEPDMAKPRARSLDTVTPDDLRSPDRSLLFTPRSPPLTPWSRLWPVLRAALQSSLPSRELDVNAYVRRVSRGELIGEIPRKTRHVWSNRFSVWIDRSSRLLPFWSDQLDVWRGLRTLCAKSGVTRRLLDGRTQMRSMLHRGDLLRGCSTATEGPILVLGDLGLYGSDMDREAWERTGKRLQARGARLTALVPGSASRFVPFMTRTWNARAWECVRRRGKPEEGWAARRDRLMKMVAPVVLLQPGLLRAIRRILPAALADASTEADVWNHADVDVADGTGWLLQSAALLQWREAFAADASLNSYREALSKTIRVWHEKLPREILRGDTLVWHALVADVAPPGDLHDAVAFAKRLEATAFAGTAEANVAEALRSFQKKLLTSMPPTIYEKVPALSTVWVASFEEGDVPPGVDAQAIRARLEEAGKTRHYALRQVGRRLVFSVNERGPAWPSHVDGPGSPVAWLEAARPWVHVDRAGRREQLRLENGLSLPADPDEPIQLRTDRCTVTLTPWRFQNEPGWTSAGRDRFGLWALAKIHGVAQRFRWIPPGRFLMGSPENEAGRLDNEGPQHGVTFTQGRWLADTPVTQGLWKAVTGENPSYFQSDRRATGDRPVEQVTWDACAKFVEAIGMRLPSEAEWEHACRAGTTTATWVGDVEIRGDNDAPQLDAIAWYSGNCGVEYDLDNGWDASDWPNKQHAFARGGTRVVGKKEPNPFGLYDMLGNVYEWCGDAYTMYTNAAAIDPLPVEEAGAGRVLRGGSWGSLAWCVRAAYRDAFTPGLRYAHFGLRLARDANPGRGTR